MFCHFCKKEGHFLTDCKQEITPDSLHLTDLMIDDIDGLSLDKLKLKDDSLAPLGPASVGSIASDDDLEECNDEEMIPIRRKRTELELLNISDKKFVIQDPFKDELIKRLRPLGRYNLRPVNVGRSEPSKKPEFDKEMIDKPKRRSNKKIADKKVSGKKKFDTNVKLEMNKKGRRSRKNINPDSSDDDLDLEIEKLKINIKKKYKEKYKKRYGK